MGIWNWDPATTKRLDTIQTDIGLVVVDVADMRRRAAAHTNAIVGLITLTERLDRKLDRCLAALQLIQQSEDAEMAKLENITAGVEQVEDVQKSVVTLIQNLHNELTQAGTDQGKLDALANRLRDSAVAMAAAVVANTEAAPVEEEPEKE
jgi:hypothetical protein